MLQDHERRAPGEPGESVTQLRHAREGLITAEMSRAAERPPKKS